MRQTLKRYLFAYTVVAFTFLNGLTAQQKPTGLLLSPDRYSKVPLMEVTGEKFNTLPLKVSLRKYCPVAGDQKSIGACVGWATGYGAMTVLLAQKTNLTNRADITERALSSAFIYNQVKAKSGNCTEGAYLEDALELLKKQGDCLEKSFNYEKNDCTIQPRSFLFTEASSYRIKDYAAVFQLDEAGNSKIAKACKILSKETPLVVGIGITPSFWQIKSGATLWNPDDTEGVSGNHAMLLIGYDNVEKEFELMNSFGPAWGRNGFIKIKFDDFERLCKYAFLLVLNDGKAQNTTIKNSGTQLIADFPLLCGAFVFRKPAGYLTTATGDEMPYFEEITTRYDVKTGIYLPNQNVFSVGDAFQLVARQIPKGQYAYVFSKSPNGKVNLHFPKKTVSGGNIANFVIDKDVEIVIPSEESILQMPDIGDDYLCIIYANDRIMDFESRLARLQADSGGDFSQKMKTVFSDILTPDHLIQYESNRMAFSATPKTDKAVVALVLKVTAK
jgi:Papain family cysteine protease